MNHAFARSDSPIEALFTRATANASKAIQTWTNGMVTLHVADVCQVSLEEAVHRLGVDEEARVMVVLQIEGESSGDFVLMFDEPSGRRLCAELLGQSAPSQEEWSELESSALLETGNILGSAFLNELTQVLTCALLPSPPTMIRDFGSSVIEQLLMMHAMESDEVYVSRTAFLHGSGERLNGQVFFVPTTALREALAGSIDKACSAPHANA